MQIWTEDEIPRGWRDRKALRVSNHCSLLKPICLQDRNNPSKADLRKLLDLVKIRK